MKMYDTNHIKEGNQMKTKYEVAILVELHDANYRIDNVIGTGKDINEAIEDVSHTYRIFEGTASDEEYAIFAFEIIRVRKMIGA
jgi:hypothetical protein